MLKKSGSLYCSCGLFGLSRLSGLSRPGAPDRHARPCACQPIRVRSCNRTFPSSFFIIPGLLPIAHSVFCVEGSSSLSRQHSLRHSTIRSAALPSHLGGITPFFHSPAINRASLGGSLLGSVPRSSFVPIVMVSGRSVLSRSAKTGWLFWSVWFIWSVSIIWLNQTNQIDQMDQIDQTDRACLRREGHRNSGVPK